MLMGKHELMSSFYKSLGLIVSFYNSKNQDIFFIEELNFDLNAIMEHIDLKSKIVKMEVDGLQSHFFSDFINCIWIIIPLSVYESYDYCIIGPSLISAVSKEHIVKNYYRNGITLEDALHIAKDFEKVPVIPYSLLTHFFYYIYFVLHGIKVNSLDVGSIFEKSNHENTEQEFEDVIDRQRVDLISLIDAEKYISECVKNGNVEGLNSRRSSVVFNISNLGGDDIRSLKNNFIVGIALITRAAVDGGLAIEIAYPLSDMYILQLENLNDVASIMKFYQNVLFDFTTKVQKNKFKVQFSLLINRCCGYVIKKVKEPLKVNDIARYLDIHPDTLSRKFKEETGRTLLDFIREIKVEDAKIMLSHTTKTLTEISNILAFSSQSQFIVSFKKVEGITPNQYRLKNR